jgi:hypothetical protein
MPIRLGERTRGPHEGVMVEPADHLALAIAAAERAQHGLVSVAAQPGPPISSARGASTAGADLKSGNGAGPSPARCMSVVPS